MNQIADLNPIYTEFQGAKKTKLRFSETPRKPGQCKI